jgi:uncharacterized protein YjbJ (UPF0337 family)
VNKDRVKGTIDEVVGGAKRKAGELTGNNKLQAEGMTQQVKGKVENAWGRTKDAVSDAVKDGRLHIDTRVELNLGTSTDDVERPRNA